MIYNFYDWDDTIVFTRRAQFKSYRDAIRHYSNYELEWEEYNRVFYGNSDIFLASLLSSQETISKIKKLKSDLYNNIYHKEVILIKKEINPSHTNIIVSNSSKASIERILNLLNIHDQFKSIITRESFLGASRKPSTDLYHYALSTINSFKPDEDTIVIHEDSYDGMISALNFSEQSRIKNIEINYRPHPEIRDTSLKHMHYPERLSNGK